MEEHKVESSCPNMNHDPFPSSWTKASFQTQNLLTKELAKSHEERTLLHYDKNILNDLLGSSTKQSMAIYLGDCA